MMTPFFIFFALILVMIVFLMFGGLASLFTLAVTSVVITFKIHQWERGHQDWPLTLAKERPEEMPIVTFVQRYFKRQAMNACKLLSIGISFFAAVLLLLVYLGWKLTLGITIIAVAIFLRLSRKRA